MDVWVLFPLFRSSLVVRINDIKILPGIPSLVILRPPRYLTLVWLKWSVNNHLSLFFFLEAVHCTWKDRLYVDVLLYQTKLYVFAYAMACSYKETPSYENATILQNEVKSAISCFAPLTGAIQAARERVKISTSGT